MVPRRASHRRPSQIVRSKIAWDKPDTSEAFAYTGRPLKEEPDKTTCPSRKYFCENELRRPLPEVPNGKTQEQEEAGPEAAEQEA
jgi:hypothetical protein